MKHRLVSQLADVMIPDHAVARSLPSYYEAPNVLLGDPGIGSLSIMIHEACIVNMVSKSSPQSHLYWLWCLRNYDGL